MSDRLIQGVPVDGRLPTPDGRMLRGQRYKYCVYSEGKNREFLVDLEKDPGEMKNLAADPAFEKLLNEHRRLLICAELERLSGQGDRALALYASFILYALRHGHT